PTLQTVPDAPPPAPGEVSAAGHPAARTAPAGPVPSAPVAGQPDEAGGAQPDADTRTAAADTDVGTGIDANVGADVIGDDGGNVGGNAGHNASATGRNRVGDVDA